MTALLPRMLFLIALASGPSHVADGAPAASSVQPRAADPDIGLIGRQARQIALLRTRRLEQTLAFLRYHLPEPAARMESDLVQAQDRSAALYFLCARGCRDRVTLRREANRLLQNLERLALLRAELEALTATADPPRGLTRGKLRTCWELFAGDLDQALVLARAMEAELAS